MEDGEELKGSFHDTLLIAEFKGAMPDIPVFKDIDIHELTAGEEKPVFVTLPIGKANAKSGNQRYYDEAFLVELEKQVQSNKPIGLMGHLSTEQRAFAFPAEAVHWVGTMRVKEYLLGKGYLPAGDSRSRLQRYKATGKKIATSIDAKADGIWDSKIEAYKMIASTLELNQIDIAPADRAGIGDLSAVPLLTQEMMGAVYTVKPITVRKEIKVTEEEKKQAMLEMTAADASVLPESVRAAIIQEYSKEIKEALGLTDGNILDAVKSIQAKDAAREKAAVSSRITEMATTGDKAIKIEAVREMVIDMVEAKNPLTVADAEKAYAEVLEKPSVKKALDLALQESMGPSQTTPVQQQTGATAGTDPKMKGKWFVLPPAQNAASN